MLSDLYETLAPNVRFGSKADIGGSALPPKADIGTQPRDVRFVPKADILTGIASPVGPHEIRGPPRTEVARENYEFESRSVLHAPLGSHRLREIHIWHGVRRV